MSTRRLYPLKNDVSFDTIGDRFEAWGLTLTRLEGCAFPSRPEAKLATWSNAEGLPVARYRYEPDIELRWLAVDRPEDRESLADRLRDSDLFESWEVLKAELLAGEWGKVFRAAAAFRVAAEVRESSIDGESTLAMALSLGGWTRRAAATQLAEVATSKSRDAIVAAREDSEDIETRMALRRALDRIEMAEFSSR